VWWIRRDVDLRQRARRLPGDRYVRALWGRRRGAGVAVPGSPAPGSGGAEEPVRALREIAFAALVGIAAGVALGWCYGSAGAL
jgi:hypothetical protein